MKAFLLSLCWLPLAASAQSAFSELHPPHLAGYYDGTLNGKLPIHAYFFPTDKDLNGLLNGFYRYGQRQSELHLAGGFLEPDSLLLEEFKGPTMAVAGRTGYLHLQFRADGSLRGTWRAAAGGPRLPMALHPVAGPGPATCAAVRVGQHRGQLPTLATTDKRAATNFAGQVASEAAQLSGDAGTQDGTLTYAGHNLVSLVLSSEMQGASITTGYRWATFDACTGNHLVASLELDPHRLEAFQEEANSRLRQAFEEYIARRGPQGSDDQLLSADDVAGLRSQQFQLDLEQLKLEDEQVIFPHYVSYEGLSSFIAKEYAGQFGAVFSFEEAQSFLRPTSPLRRLVLPPPARALAPSPQPPQAPPVGAKPRSFHPKASSTFAR
jgi:hypothetical protein